MMSAYVSIRHRITPVRMTAAGAVILAGVSLTGFAVFAGLNAVATNTSPQSVSSGTLKLTMADNGNGFSQQIANMAPGDVANRYVTVTNGGNLDAQGLTLGASDATPSKLTTDATNGLHVSVTQCTGGTWNTSTGVCSGSTTSLLASTALSSLSSTAASLVTTAIPAGATYALKMAVALPDQNETTTNGTLPSGTIQGLSASLTWTFNEAQRTATTTNG